MANPLLRSTTICSVVDATSGSADAKARATRVAPEAARRKATFRACRCTAIVLPILWRFGCVRAANLGYRRDEAVKSVITAMELPMGAVLRATILLLVLTSLGTPLAAQEGQPPPGSQYAPGELVSTGHRFFGTVSRGLASVIEKAVSQWGQPNGYILGQEAGGAFVAGLRYGEGTLYTRNAGDLRVFWQGPSIGFDWGGEGARTMMLVYRLPATDAIYQRYAGIDGSAYFVGGFGMTALGSGNILVVPIRSGVGLRLGANIGYLHFTRAPTWNPF